MKNKLLITTALVAMVSASNVYAETIGEIIDVSDETIHVEDNTIISGHENSRANYGGAISVGPSTNELTIGNNVTLDNNKTVSSGGSMLAMNGFTAGDNFTIKNSEATKGGGALYIKLADSTAEPNFSPSNRDVVIGENALFEGNTSGWGLGGAIAIESANNVTIGDGAIFRDNKGGAIAVWSDKNKFNGEEITTGTTLNLSKATFENNEGTKGGAVANLEAAGGSTVLNTINIKDSLFTDNKATDVGGAVYSKEGTTNIATSKFERNSATKNGGAIYNEGTMTINNSTMQNNSSKGYGGAIMSRGELTLNNVNFDSNKSYVGGAISTGFNDKGTGKGKLAINGGNFSNNEAEAGGGAIANYGALKTNGDGTLEIKNTSFIGNKVTGVVVDDGYNNHNLNSSIDGGAAIFAGSASSTNITNSKFANNSSSASGGAISTRADWFGADGKTINTKENAPEGYDSSTDYLKANSKAQLTIASSEFSGNKASTNGGAIYNTFENTSIADSVFSNNESNLGGAIYNEKVAKLALTGNNIFSGNKANGKLNDIHNLGAIEASGNLTLDGGISGDGTLTLAEGTNLNVKTDTTTISNKVVNNGANLGLTFANGYAGGAYALITDGGTLDNEFKIAENGIYKIQTDADNKGTYNISKKSTGEISASTGANANQAGAISAITNGNSDSASFNNIANSISNLMQSSNKADVKAALDATTALAPEAAAMVQSASTENANQVFGAVGSRLSGGSVSSASEGMSSGDNGLENGAMWVQGLINKSKLDTDNGFDADSSGIAMGAEKYINSNVKAGVGYAYTKTDIDGFMRQTDVDTHTAIAYGEYKPSNWFVNGIATYGWSDYSEKKNVAGNQVKADYDVDTVGLQAMTGYDLNTNIATITPEAGLRYVNIKQDAYKDSADQKVGSNSSDILTGVIGAKIKKDFALENGMNLRPEARLAMTYDLMNDDANSVVTLANGSAYSVQGEALDRFGVEVGAGLTADINDNVEMSLGYEGKFRQDYSDHTGLVNAKYKF